MVNNVYLKHLFERYKSLNFLEDEILRAFNLIKTNFANKGTLFVCGNGGSASDSEHIAGELLKGFILSRDINNPEFEKKIKKLYGDEGESICNSLQEGFKVISLTSHPSFNTAFSNDVQSDMNFAQQLYALASSGDVLLGISTSGNSKNVYKAFLTASALNLKTILLTGAKGGKCSEIADCSIKVPSNITYEIQEYHLPVYHTICLMLEEHFYGSR